MRAAAALLVLSFCARAHAGFLWQRGVSPGSLLVVGVRVEGREVAVVEALSTPSEVCLPVGDFARAAGISWSAAERKLVTPLGAVVLTAGELAEYAGELYLCPEVASARLGVLMSFDPAEVVVTLDLPWPLAQPAAWVPPPLRPEVRAPAWGLGTVRGDLWVLREGSSTQRAGTALVTGRAVAGEWRVLLDQTQGEGTGLREFLWSRRWERHAVLLGRLYQQISPVFSGFDMVGGQWLWSNEPLPKLPGSGGGPVLPIASALRSFRGPAPVGSVVRLRLDGVVVASQTVGVSGRYEFVDVPVAGRGVAVAEVEIFDRHNLLVPKEVRRELVSAAAMLLPQGRRIQALGVGLAGYLGRDLLAPDSDLKPAAFYSVRWGATPTLTVEFLTQVRENRYQAGLGWAATPKPWWLLSGEVARGKGGNAYVVESYVFRRSFEVTGRFLQQDRGFGLLEPVLWDRHDRSLEVRRFWGRWLELGLWARDATVGSERIRWVRPTAGVSWGSTLFARVFPDSAGDMTGILSLNPHPRWRLAAGVSRTQTYDLQWELPSAREWVWRTTWETGGSAADRVTTTLGNRPTSWGGLAWRVGVSRSGPHTGAYAEASLRLMGGFFLRAEYQGVPTRAVENTRMRSRLFLSLTADYAYASGLFSPAGSLSVQRETGAIAGRLVAFGNRVSLAGARVLVRGVGGATTDSEGRFFVGSVPPGVYEVELDPEKLPVELSPRRWRTVVEVLAGVTTRVDFPLEVLLGFAGRVTDGAGQPVPGLKVVVLGGGAQPLASTVTDPFGLYRFDQLPSGRYTVRALGPQGETLGERTVELTQFLFDQDLQLSVVFEFQP